MNTQDWSPLGWTGWISWQFKELQRVFSNTSSKASIFWHSAFFTVQLSHPYMNTEKNIAFTRRTFVGKVMSLLFNMLSRLVITFFPRSKGLLISWLQSPSAVILQPPKIQSVTVSTLSPSISHRHGMTNCFQIGKGVCQSCILSPCLFNLYAEYIMRNAGLDEAQAGIKAAGRNTDNLR